MLLLPVLAIVAACIVIFLCKFAAFDADLTLLYREAFDAKIASLRNKVVWISGASSGIGAAVAVELATAGAKLVLSSRKVDQLQKVRNKCLAVNENCEVLVIECDVTIIDAFKSVVDRVLQHFGQIDVLFNNAGVVQVVPFARGRCEDERAMFATNVVGPVELTRIVVRHWMKSKHRGHVAVTSSFAGKNGVGLNSAYSGAKHALHGYFDSMRLEVGNLIYPLSDVPSLFTRSCTIMLISPWYVPGSSTPTLLQTLAPIRCR